MWIHRIFLLVMLLISSVSFSKNQLVYFEPKTVALGGVIRTLHFPGPPNYESIKNGDADEKGPYLILNEPVDIKLVSIKKIGNDHFEKNVTLLQLVVLNKNDWKNIKEGYSVHVTGTLSNALTGHHHARALLTIKEIKLISKQKNVDKKLNITKEDWQFLKHQN